MDQANLERFGPVMAALTIVMLHFRRVPSFRLNPISVFLV
jgi:hypothetical protein